MMRRPGYREAVEWMILNDDVTWARWRLASISVTGAMVRDLYGVKTGRLRKDIRRGIKANFTTEPKYPGEAIRQTMLIWPFTGETGDVRIMDYGKGAETRYRVACFCPGRTVVLPGDTPKTEPECDKWCATFAEANEWFDLYVDREKRDGWTSPTVRRAVA